MLNALKRDILR